MSNELITEARELCEKAIGKEWVMYEWEQQNYSINTNKFREPGICADVFDINVAKFIARSRTLVPELANALEKANAEIERLQGTCTKCPGLTYIISHGGVTTQEDTHD